ncbi:MAG: glycosyltransferase, partial [Gammaproteobacteria bacterium]
MTKIHFHSDCPFFAGCENMIANFLNSQEFHSGYSISFSFAYSDAYIKGFKFRVNRDISLYPIKFFDLTNFFNLSQSYPVLLQRIINELVRIILGFPLMIYEVIYLYRLFKKINPKILHLNNGGYPAARSVLAASLAGKLCRVPSIIMVVNNMALGYKNYSRWFDLPIDRLVAKSVNCFVTGSKAAAKQLQLVLSLPDSKIRSIYNGIQIRESSKTILSSKKRLGIEKFEGVIFGVVAQLIPRKGHQVLLDAVLQLSKSNQPLNFLILIEGTGHLYENLLKFVDENQLQKKVVFVGHEDNIVDFMSVLDVLILPSIRDED